jgi:hypothetical protein
MRNAFIATLCLSLACVSSLPAQSVRGTVLEDGADRPIPEAVVTLVNSDRDLDQGHRVRTP